MYSHKYCDDFMVIQDFEAKVVEEFFNKDVIYLFENAVKYDVLGLLLNSL